MKRILPHLLWLVVAVAAYIFGSRQSEPAATDVIPGGQSAGNGLAGSVLPSSKAKAAAKASSNEITAAAVDGPSFSAALEKMVKAATTSNPIEQQRGMAQLLASLTTENAAEILGAMHEAGADDEAMGLLVYAWAAKDGEAAMAFADEMGDAMSKEDAFGYRNQVVKGWASSDPNSAMAWVDGLGEDVKGVGHFRWNLVSGMADGNLAAASDYVVQRAEAEDRGAPKFMDMIAERMLREAGVSESVGWAEGLPESGIKTAALRRVATDFVAEDPIKAADWASDYVDADHGPRLIHEVSDEWAERDPAAAVEWLETLPDGDAKSAGMSAALTEWVKRGDPMEASKYLADMPVSPQRDQAVAGFASTLAYTDPESAMTWATTIEDNGARDRAMIEAGRAWMRVDPASATQWVQSNDLGDSVAQGITAPRGKRDGK